MYGYYCSRDCLVTGRGEITAAQRRAIEKAKSDVAGAVKLGRLVCIVFAALLVIGGLGLLWKIFLDPTGSICWQWQDSADLNQVRLLGTNDSSVFVHDGDRILTLGVRNGKPHYTLPVGDLGESSTRLECSEDVSLLFGSDGFAGFDGEGTEVYRTRLAGNCRETALSPNMTMAAFYMTPRTVTHPDETRTESPALAAYDLSNGQPVWSKTLSNGVTVKALAVGSGRVYGVFSQPTDTFQRASSFGALDSADGRLIWQVDLEKAPGWGPFMAADLVLFKTDATVHAFAADGTEAWTLELADGTLSCTVRDGVLFAFGSEGTACYETAGGTLLWQHAMTVSPSHLFACRKRVYLWGSLPADEAGQDEEGSVTLPPAYEQNRDVLADVGIDLNQPQLAKAFPTLVCVERESGRELWKRPHVVGRFYVDEKRIVLFMDTSETSMLEKIGGGKGVTVIRQFDPRDGSMMYSRESDIAIHTPKLVGDRLVAVAHERVDKPGLIQGFGSISAGINRRGKVLGVVAFDLR